MNQKVSVIMPTRDRITYVERAVDSVLAQTYENWELLILDDSIREKARVTEMGKADSRIILVQRPGNTTPAWARLHGVQSSSGYYLTFLDSDDYWSRDRLEKHVLVWENHLLGLSWDSWIEIEDGLEKYVFQPIPANSVIAPPVVARKLFRANFIHASAGFTAKRFIEVSGFPSWTPLSDWALYLRLAEQFPAYRIGETLTWRDLDSPERVGAKAAELTNYPELIRYVRAVRADAIRRRPDLYCKDGIVRPLLEVLAGVKNRDSAYCSGRLASLAEIFLPKTRSA